MHPIFAAIDVGDIQLVHGLLHMNPAALNGVVGDYGQSPLMHAISNMDRTFELVEFLVAQGADVNFATNEGYTPLHSNIGLNGPSGTGGLPYRIARLLKDRGADPEARNHYGWTPLMRAGLEGTDDEFEALLKIGAKYDVEYTPASMPRFTRGRSLANIVLPSPEKMALLLAYGFKPQQSLLGEGEREIAEAKDPASDYCRDVAKSLELIKAALPPGA